MQRQQHKSPAHQLSYRLRSLADVLDCMNITPSHAADTIVKAAAVLSQIPHAVRHTATHSLPFGRLTFAKTCTCQLFLLPGEHRRWVPTHRLREIFFSMSVVPAGHKLTTLSTCECCHRVLLHDTGATSQAGGLNPVY